MAAPSKKIKAIVKLQIEAGKATPAPPIGTALGPHGVNIADFVNQYNNKTKDKMGEVIPCVLTIFEDRSFKIELKTPPVASLILKSTGIKKGSETANVKKVGKIKRSEVKRIAEIKLQDLNTTKLDSAMRIVEGTAHSMGIEVVD
ncbi:MAG TPA: 50S ribosomal protein L11 [Candidatus Dojkabacteria bacterium]|nr:50S ribosomal protein L11 [Candidatus Dojkabacteria bacterium]HRP36510.1 50S ribosomal protein L11 [Candidatus Dojkabacteria bacterium]HRP51547.1 50S ribosomal protein L11 [Candidatus Dojkabacteria bacterium]